MNQDEISKANEVVKPKTVFQNFNIIITNIIVMFTLIINGIVIDKKGYIIIIGVLCILIFASVVETKKYNYLVKNGVICKAKVNDVNSGGIMTVFPYSSGTRLRINKIECYTENCYFKKTGLIVKIDYFRELGYVYVMYLSNNPQKYYMFLNEIVFSENDFFNSKISPIIAIVFMSINIIVIVLLGIVLYI